MAESNARPPATRTIRVVTAALIAAVCIAVGLWLLLTRGDDDKPAAGGPIRTASDIPVTAPVTASLTSPAAPAGTPVTPGATPSSTTPPGTRSPTIPADGRLDTRTISFTDARGLPKVFAVAESAAQDANVLAGVFAGNPSKRPPEPTPATDFAHNVVVSVTVEAGCLDPEGARLYADRNRLRLDVRLPDRKAPPECLAPYIRLARFEVPRTSMPNRPVLDGRTPGMPTADTRP
ncbi:hypothetical protein [Embleya scabrispora]|uniref:hypothetical protein n=1 Tax=Embleya scabrispora TaxID=159449 RepID=UPI0003A2CAEA|nr:hypothetical protein [Embleya scabrispora]MYS84727.1 hypothetical protein [Streptomyces sp. SID5474]